MDTPLQIKVRDIPRSESFESLIRDRAEKLQAVHDRITNLQVVVEAPHRHKHHGFLYNVRIRVSVPGRKELVVKRESHEDLFVAIRDAFEAARRKLSELSRRQRGEIKAHAEQPHGKITKLFLEEGYGFLETEDGREVYFHENSVLNGGFKFLEVGDQVRFSEEQGVNGPQASSLTVTGAGAR